MKARLLVFRHCGIEATEVSKVLAVYPDRIRFYFQCPICNTLVYSENTLFALRDFAATNSITSYDREFLAEYHISIGEEE